MLEIKVCVVVVLQCNIKWHIRCCVDVQARKSAEQINRMKEEKDDNTRRAKARIAELENKRNLVEYSLALYWHHILVEDAVATLASDQEKAKQEISQLKDTNEGLKSKLEWLNESTSLKIEQLNSGLHSRKLESSKLWFENRGLCLFIH